MPALRWPREIQISGRDMFISVVTSPIPSSSFEPHHYSHRESVGECYVPFFPLERKDADREIAQGVPHPIRRV